MAQNQIRIQRTQCQLKL
ncbi:hypothetical protein ACOMHN_016161 [Nucella lapillus]